MKAIFLDIDGVLNSRPFLETMFAQKVDMDDHLDPQAIARLNRITDQTGAHLVLSSTWRYKWMYNLTGLQPFFTKHGVRGLMLGITPTDLPDDQCRGDQIQWWLDHNQLKVESFVILDDDNDMGHLSHRLVQTSFNDGLQDAHVEQAIRLLNT